MRAAAEVERQTWPAFVDIVRGRASVRYFDDRPVPRPLVEQILEAGAWAPSPHGRQPWRFAVLSNPATKRRLAESMGETWQRQLALDGEPPDVIARSEERRVGKECRSRWSPYH